MRSGTDLQFEYQSSTRIINDWILKIHQHPLVSTVLAALSTIKNLRHNRTQNLCLQACLRASSLRHACRHLRACEPSFIPPQACLQARFCATLAATAAGLFPTRESRVVHEHETLLANDVVCIVYYPLVCPRRSLIHNASCRLRHNYTFRHCGHAHRKPCRAWLLIVCPRGSFVKPCLVCTRSFFKFFAPILFQLWLHNSTSHLAFYSQQRLSSSSNYSRPLAAG